MDMVMCENGNCELVDSCLRYTGEQDNLSQSFLVNPMYDCQNNTFKYFVPNKPMIEKQCKNDDHVAYVIKNVKHEELFNVTVLYCSKCNCKWVDY